MDREIIEPVEWFFSFLPSEFRGKNTCGAVQYLEDGVVFPFAENYYSKFPAIFSYNIMCDSNIDDYKLIILRDGLLTLLPFLIFNEKKIIQNEIIYAVNYKFRNLIPESFEENIIFYMLDNSNDMKLTKDKLLVVGLFAFNSISKEYIRNYLKNIENFLVKNPEIELEVYLELGRLANVEILSYFILSLKKIKRISKFWNEKDFSTINKLSTDLSGYYISDINPGLVYGNDYVIFSLLSLGGLYLNSQFRDVDIEEELDLVELSNYHHFELYEDCLSDENKIDEGIFIGIKMLFEHYQEYLSNDLIYKRFGDEKDHGGKYSFIIWDQYLKYLSTYVLPKLEIQ